MVNHLKLVVRVIGLEESAKLLGLRLSVIGGFAIPRPGEVEPGADPGDGGDGPLDGDGVTHAHHTGHRAVFPALADGGDGGLDGVGDHLLLCVVHVKDSRGSEHRCQHLNQLFFTLYLRAEET